MHKAAKGVPCVNILAAGFAGGVGVGQLKTAAATKDEFLAVLSHELRTPLAAIAGWTGVLKVSESPEDARRAVEAIERNVGLQSRMVDDLLDVNRTGSRKKSDSAAIHRRRQAYLRRRRLGPAAAGVP